MFQKFGINGVKHSSGFVVCLELVYKGGQVKYVDGLIEAKMSCESIVFPDKWDGIGFLPKPLKRMKEDCFDGIAIWPKTLKVMRQGVVIGLSDEEKEEINKRIQDGVDSLGLKIQIINK